ncbi:hypothetical protein M9Y10_041700 [Tritrichomonas musculus]|uniref:HNH nuclease domain-containing protein n=1 Tax=Tritrichomonas musculus TaxID=1915356 RepID=A0ABR2K548_9EUKA
MSQTEQPISNDEAEFVPLKDFEADYEIQTTFPYNIRKKKNQRILKETLKSNDGYFCVGLNKKIYLKHRLIAKQFIPNPDNLPQVDHINRNRTDNRLENLRWVSSSTNLENKTFYKGIQAIYIDDIPFDAAAIEWYETRTERRLFETNKYYYYHDNEKDEDIFYSKIGDNIYKILNHNHNKTGNLYISLRDVNNKIVSLYINRYKFQHDLM